RRRGPIAAHSPRKAGTGFPGSGSRYGVWRSRKRVPVPKTNQTILPAVSVAPHPRNSAGGNGRGRVPGIRPMNYARMLLRLICVGGLGRWIPHRHDGRSTRSRVALASAWSVLGLATLAGGWSLVAPDHSPPPEPFTRASF